MVLHGQAICLAFPALDPGNWPRVGNEHVGWMSLDIPPLRDPESDTVHDFSSPKILHPELTHAHAHGLLMMDGQEPFLIELSICYMYDC